MAKKTHTILDVDGEPVRVSSPDKVWFPAAGLTKLDVIRYWVAVGDAAVRGVAGRPMALERFVKGLAEPPFYQKRAPKHRPDWIEVATLRYPSGRTADEVVVRTLPQLLWVVNLGCFSLHPHPTGAEDLHHPDELRIDLDPVPGVPWTQVRQVADVVRGVLDEQGLVGWPKTSGKRGLHVWVRIAPRWSFDDVRRAALAVARRVEAEAPRLATSAWWKEDRHGVFVDYNQNAKDHTMAAAWSVRPTDNAQVSMPLAWEQIADAEPSDFTVETAPGLLAAHGDPHREIDAAVGELDGLLSLADAQDSEIGPVSRRTRPPTLVIAESEDADAARAGLERWRARHPDVFARLEPRHVLIDKMRGRYRTWTRIRVNLEAVPESERPAQEPLDPDDAPVVWRP